MAGLCVVIIQPQGRIISGNSLWLVCVLLLFSHKDISSVDPVELCSTLTSATDKRRSVVNHADQFGHTPLHLAARRGAGVCAIHLIQVFYLPILNINDTVTKVSALIVSETVYIRMQ